jgi:hypothetical protein
VSEKVLVSEKVSGTFFSGRPSLNEKARGQLLGKVFSVTLEATCETRRHRRLPLDEAGETGSRLTPEERARIEKEETELFRRWSERLSKAELKLRLQTYGDVHDQLIESAQVEIEGLKGVLWMWDHGYADLGEALRTLNSKKTRTPEEDKAFRDYVRYLRQRAKEPPSQ